MLTIEERIAQLDKKERQLENKKRLQGNRTQKEKEKEKMDLRRKYLLGEIVLECFPYLVELTPRSTTEENEIEFEEFKRLMESVAEVRKQSGGLNGELARRGLDK